LWQVAVAVAFTLVLVLVVYYQALPVLQLEQLIALL
jgi:hypothetical protein